jgi:hypothetical protein
MRKIIQTLGAAAIAAVVGMTTFTATAAPVAPVGVQLTSNVEMAQYRQRNDDKPRWKKPQKRMHDRVEHRQDRRGYWNGHRGYREKRRGYRRHSDGYYYAPEVFKLFR